MQLGLAEWDKNDEHNTHLADYLVVSIHLPSKAMCLRITNLDFEETFRDAVHFFYLQVTSA